MQQNINFCFSLPLDLNKKLKRIKEKSFYDHNYYQLEPYGDWVDFGKDNNNILYEVYHECENCYYYYLGRFENDKFIEVLGFGSDGSILDGIDIESV